MLLHLNSLLLNLQVKPLLKTAFSAYCTFQGLTHRFALQSSHMQDLDVLYFSKNFIVVNKEYDVFINNDDPTKTRSLARQLCNTYPNLVIPSLKHGFYFPHRLDYATSGVICIALNKKACAAASGAFRLQQTQKYYLALVHGHVRQDLTDVCVPIGEDEREIGEEGNHQMCVEGPHCIDSRAAHTRILVLERGIYQSSPATKLLLRLITGRRHQLRVHCAHIGHTIVGDYTYSNRTDLLPPRMFLHAYRLVNPNNIEPLDIRTEDPFTQILLKDTWVPTENVHTLNEDSMKVLRSAVFCDHDKPPAKTR